MNNITDNLESFESFNFKINSTHVYKISKTRNLIGFIPSKANAITGWAVGFYFHNITPLT